MNMQEILNHSLRKTQQHLTKIPLYTTSVNEKLRKRTLRSKITKILKDQFYDKCKKQRQSNDDEKVKRLHDQMHLEKTNDPTFKSKRMIFSPYNSRQYLTGVSFYETQNLISPELLLDLTDQEKVLRVIKHQLTKNDLIEQKIGEDPAYFIQNPEVRELNWIDDVTLESKKKSFSFKTSRMISSESHLLKPKTLLRQLNYDPLEVKEQLLSKRREFFKLQNKKRVDNFITNHQREQERKSNIDDKLNKRYLQKLQQTDDRMNALFEGVDQHKQINKQLILDKQNMINQNLKNKQEDDEINMMTQMLRRVCVEKQVNFNVKAHLKGKIDKIKSICKTLNK